MKAEIEAAKQAGDSVGGTVECAALGVPAGLGEPMFDGVENVLSRLAFAVPGVKGIEFGDGFELATRRGSETNDPYRMQDGAVCLESNHMGGILGGITNGQPLLFRAAFKPTPSISIQQHSVSFSEKKNVELSVKGRHDPCIVPRGLPCMEAVMAIGIIGMMLEAGAWN